VPAASNPLTAGPVLVGMTTVRSTDWCRQPRALPDTEFSTVLDRVAAATDLSEQWLADYPIVRRDSVTEACALAAAVAIPSLPVPGVALLTRWWLWIFGLDDRFDDPAVPDEELAGWAPRFTAALHAPTGSQVGGEDDLLLTAFASIARDLACHPLFGQLAPDWRTGMQSTVDGMLVERRWAAGLPDERLPSYPAYVANGLRTISVLPYTVVACIAADDAAAAASFDRLRPDIHRAARCFRLTNDLASVAREHAEGKLNAVSLLVRRLTANGMTAGAATALTRRRIKATCDRDLAGLYAARRSAPPELQAMTRFLCEHAAFVTDLYAVGDYDTVSAELRAVTMRV